jgi:DNA-binding response OmpR family regulator
VPTHIVIVDDDPDFREFVHIVLETHGYEVHEAHNAMEGLALTSLSLLVLPTR